MPYTSNIPMANDDLSVSQPQIQNNFTAIAAAFNLNHVNFNATFQGMHMFVEMPNQSTAPFNPPVTLANEVGLYCGTSTLTNQPELFFIKQLGSTSPANLNPPISMNGYAVTGSNYIDTNGWTRLPSGILLMWGQGGLVGTNPFTVTLPISASIPNFYTIYQVLITSTANASGIATAMSLGALTQPTNGIVPTPGIFVVFGSAAGTGFKYLVIGV